MKRLNGIHLRHQKLTAGMPLRTVPLPELVRLPMLMHMGAPCIPAVKPKEAVRVGQLIGAADGSFSVPIHASVSGTVRSISVFRTASGKEVPCVDIEPDGQQLIYAGCRPPELNSREDLVKAARDAGCVGLGGAGFPTHVKLGTDKKLTTLIVNGAECEPFLTSDDYQMHEAPEEVIGGIALVMKLLKIKQARIGIETNKPTAITKLSALAADYKGIEVCPLPPVYPQGAEKVLIFHTTGAVIPEGKLPADLGFLTLNVSTCAFLYRYSQTGIPLVERTVTVDGDCVRNPGNYIVPVGTPAQTLLEASNCNFKILHTLLSGGPMMGMPLSSTEMPILKQQNGLLAMRAGKIPQTTACIRCGRCMDACPMRLMPMELDRAYRKQDTAMLRQYHVELCMNCGCCTYVCPAKRPLAQTNQLAKALLPKP